MNSPNGVFGELIVPDRVLDHAGFLAPAYRRDKLAVLGR
jgi:hypothetical protein